MRHVVAWGGLALATVGGCNAIFGVSDLSYDAPSSSSSTGGSGGSGGAVGGQGGTGGEGPLAYCDRAPADEGPGVEELWALSGSGNVIGQQLGIDGDGRVVLGLTFAGELPLVDESLTADGEDVVVMALTDVDAVAWSTVVGGAGVQGLRQLRLAPNGTVYVTGRYEGVPTVGGVTLAAAPPLGACYVAGFDADTGATLFAHAVLGATSCTTPAIAVRPEGGLIMAGEHEGTLAVDAANVLAAPIGSGAFLLELDVNGVMVGGAASLDDTGDEGIKRVVVAANGDRVIAGQFNGLSFTVAQSTLPQLEGVEAFVANLGTLWAQPVQGNNAQRGDNLLARPDGSVVMGVASGGDATVGGTAYTGQPWLLAAYAPDGQLLWSDDHPPNSGDLDIRQLVTSPQNGIYAVARFEDQIAFGNLPPVTANGLADGAVIARAPDGTPRWVVPAVSPSNAEARGAAVDCRGFVWVTGSFRDQLTFGDQSAGGGVNDSAFVARLLR